ncbi:MAG: hypothetical protein GEV10_26125 [Streptosporangiales bacterium]|nr:hypothetical protein [Streptosporangiales bacterium]
MRTAREEHALLVDELRTWSDGIVAAEVRRLTGRVPQLTDGELQAIRGTLAELVETTLLTRAQALPDRATHLRALFALD